MSAWSFNATPPYVFMSWCLTNETQGLLCRYVATGFALIMVITFVCSLQIPGLSSKDFSDPYSDKRYNYFCGGSYHLRIVSTHD